jgi:hypothetical protein
LQHPATELPITPSAIGTFIPPAGTEEAMTFKGRVKAPPAHAPLVKEALTLALEIVTGEQSRFVPVMVMGWVGMLQLT